MSNGDIERGIWRRACPQGRERMSRSLARSCIREIRRLSVPADMEELVSTGQLKVMSIEFGAITLAEVDAPSNDLAALMDQTEANMKATDGALQVLGKGRSKINGVAYRVLEVAMTMPKHGPVYSATALLLHQGKLLSVQVVGPQDKKAELSAIAKAMFESIQPQAAH